MSAVRKSRVTITLNRELLRSVDRDAKERKQPRSVVIEECLQQSILDRQIREYYADEPAADRTESSQWAERGAEALARLNQRDPWPSPALSKKRARRSK
jgi:predicted transcriptional regulator